MMTYTKPTRIDYEEFLVQVVYGPCTDYLSACIESSYLDFCRTMHGFGKLPSRNAIYCRALTTLTNHFRQLPSDTEVRDQDSFDRWHEEVTKETVQIFLDGSFEAFPGQLQKWINMSLKNIFVCGESRITGYDRIYNFCHMPIDNIMLDQLQEMGMRRPTVAWSRWKYPEYLEYQKTLRDKFQNQPLLNVEHSLWIAGR